MALRIVAGISNGISGGQACEAPLFGHNVLVASHDEDLWSQPLLQMYACCNTRGEEILMKSVADSGHSCQTQRSDSKKSRNRTPRRLLCVSGSYGLSQDRCLVDTSFRASNKTRIKPTESSDESLISAVIQKKSRPENRAAFQPTPTPAKIKLAETKWPGCRRAFRKSCSLTF